METNPDATQEGVSTEEQQEKSTEHLPSLVDRRQTLIDSIAKGVEEANQADMVEFDGEKLIEKGAEGTQPPEGAKPADTTPPQKRDDTPASQQPAADEPKEKLVIDGQEQEVPLSKILDAGKRALQKDLAADKRLEEATKLLRRAEEIASQVPPGKGAQSTDDPPKSDADKTQLRELLKAIRYGNDDEAETAFEKAIGGAGSAKSPDVNEILTTVETRLAGKTILSKFAQPADQGGFADIDADPDLKLLAARKVDDLIRSGKSALEWSTYEEAGNYVRGKFGKAPTALAEQSNNALEEKAKRKGRIDNIPSAGGRVPKTPTPDDDQPKSTQDVILEMKRSRVGQG
ncbi:MAG: hypothetical protein ABFD97_20395 [Syntrophobacter sp.]